MHPDFWHQRWREGRIGFHQDTPTPLLVQHWRELDIPLGSRVLVPLCGKSVDLAWLASQGMRVLGVELSQVAVEQFFEEHGLRPTVERTASGLHHRAGEIEILCGDVFDLDDGLLAGCDAVLDRAALIALPPAMRRRYADTVFARLPAGVGGLLVTLEYPQCEKAGPPFSVDAEEIRALFADHWDIEELQLCDILDGQPGFAAEGVTRLHTVAWRLRRR